MTTTVISARDLFWFTAGLLATLAAGFVLSPWLGRGSWVTQAERGPGRRWPVLMAALLAVCAVLLYAYWGSPNQPSPRAVPVSGALSHGGTAVADAGSMDSVRARLEQRLAAQGGSSADWELLAQTYDFLGRAADAQRARTQQQLPADVALPTGAPQAAASAAATARTPLPASPRIEALRTSAAKARRARDYRKAVHDYAELAQLGALDAQAWADYADADASLQGGKLAGDPEHLIAAALSQDPGNEKALWLEASLQHETGRYQQAVGSWKALLQKVPPGSSDAGIFSANLAEDQTLSGSSDPVAAAAVAGEVALAPALQRALPARATLFVIARALGAAGPPVAVLRVPAGAWPLAFHLDDSLAMLPGHTLSSAGRVSVQARISLSGAALASAGDLQSRSLQVDPRSGSPVHLLIDQIVR